MVNRVINVIKEINYRCNYMQVFLFCIIIIIIIYIYIYIYIYIKYNLKTCNYTVSALYQMINLNVSTW